jgi:uncharacterized membrane protein YjgN (DUF898 family)
MAAGVPTDFAGRRGPLFRLALRTGLLTVLTLGLYRFWMKTRLRRYYWSSVRPGGHPLEYVGEPMEKLLGFLIAVVALAFYIGIVNLVLMYLSFALLHGNVTAYALSFVGVIPIWFYAMYRARRYVLARTRWRGLRFGADPGAWGYAGRALLHWGITILSLGILWPRMTFMLEKYKIDRTWLGNQRLHQGGRWQMLYPVFLPALLSGVLLAIGLYMVGGGDGAGGALAAVGSVTLLPALVHYAVQSRRLLANTRTAGPLGLVAQPRTGRVLGIYAGGYALILVALGALIFAALIAFGTLFGIAAATLPTLEDLPDVPAWIPASLGVASYFLVFLLWGVLGHVFVTLPLWRHYAETLTVTGTENLSALRQRPRDELAQAEGFAEALDLGAAI